MVARIFKLDLWRGVNPNYPKQYVCHLDVYFDSSIKLPLSERAWSRPPPEYPQDVSPSYRRVVPFDAQDEQAIRTSEPASMYPKALPMIFVDKPLDGRFSSLGMWEYHPNLLPGLAHLSLSAHSATGACSMVAPKAEKGILWLSLFGDNPYGIISC